MALVAVVAVAATRQDLNLRSTLIDQSRPGCTEISNTGMSVLGYITINGSHAP